MRHIDNNYKRIHVVLKLMEVYERLYQRTSADRPTEYLNHIHFSAVKKTFLLLITF